MNEDESGGDALLIGVDIGGTKTAVVISSSPPAILGRLEFPTLPQDGPERALRLIQQYIQQLLDRFGVQRGQLSAIGVSCGGPLDRHTGTIQAPPNLSTWIDVPVKERLQSAFEAECRLENDANAGAVAEFRFGAGRGVEHMVFLTMGTGLGAGIIANGGLYRGASDSAGEIGHVRLTPSGPTGYHKAGSVEGWASGSGMAQVAEQEIYAARARGEVSLLIEGFQVHGTVTARDVLVAMQQGDGLAQRVVDTTGGKLGETLALLVDVLNPQRIVIGGLALRFGESLLAPARAVMHKEALGASAACCEVIPAELGEAIGDIAAICVAMGL